MGAYAEHPLTRRHALTGIGLTVAAPAVAGCGAEEPRTAPTNTPVEPSSPPASSPTASGIPSTEAPRGLVSTSEVPVGGGVVLEQEELVVTQPTAGEFKGYTAVCTHQGCLVNKVEDGVIECPCHFSRYSVSDGSVQDGPAPEPLAPVELAIRGDQIDRA